MTIKDLADAAREVIQLRGDYAGKHVGSHEMALDPILYGYLPGRFEYVSRQHRINIAGSTKRIDFRQGGYYPIVFELAVRPAAGGGQLYGTTNHSELQKLTRVPQSVAQMRVMLLVDLARDPLNLENLEASFDRVGTGPGNYKRHSVRVLYVQRHKDHHFIWRPWVV